MYKGEALMAGTAAGIVMMLSFLLGFPKVGMVALVLAAASFGAYLVLKKNPDVLSS
jgi:hypothetical protein